MTRDWRTNGRSRGFRTAGIAIGAALFLWAVGGFLFALIRPFEGPRLFILVCDDDPATAGAGPLRRLAEANPRGVVFRDVDTTPGTRWLDTISDLGREVRPRDRVLVSVRGRWIDQPTAAIGGHAANGRTGPLEATDLIDAVDALPAATIVLCIDDSDPDLDQFAERVRESEQQNRDRRVVIVTSHGFGEESFPLPGRRCTTFLHAIADALGERADRDHDGGLSVREFVKAVTRDVDGWAAELTAGRESQSTRTLWTVAESGDQPLCPVLSPAIEDPPTTDEPTTEPTLASLLGDCWTRADELVARCVDGDTPLVACRDLRRELLELERRVRFGEESSELRISLESMSETLESLESNEPTPRPLPAWAHVIQMAQRRPSSPVQPHVSSERAFLGELQKKLASSVEPGGLIEWLDSSNAPEGSRVPGLLRRFASSSEVPETLWRPVLGTRIAMELFALGRTSTVGRDSLERAERRQLRAERLLLDAVEVDWARRSARAGGEARRWLARAKSSVALHAKARGSARNAILVLPDLLDGDERLQFWENDPAEVGAVLDDALAALESLRARLGTTASWDDEVVEHELNRLLGSRERLLQPLQRIVRQSAATTTAPPPAVEIARLLRTELPSAGDRATLLEAWNRVAADLPVHAPRPTSAGKIIVRGLASGLARNCRRRIRYDSLFDVDATAAESSADRTSRESVIAAMAEHTEGGPLLSSVLEYERLANHTASRRPALVRKAIESFLPRPLDPQSAGLAETLWNTFDGFTSSNELPTSAELLRERIERNRMIGRVDADTRRTMIGLDDASEWETSAIAASIAANRVARPRADAWPPPSAPSPVTVVLPSRLTLSSDEFAELIVESPGSRGARLSVQYDVSEFDVRLADGSPLLPAASPPIPYAMNSEPAGLPVPTSGRVTLAVRARSRGEADGALIVRIRTEHGTARAVCRLERAARLPFAMSIESSAGAIEESSGWTITPYTGHDFPLEWSLENRTSRARTADVQLFAVDSLPPSLPRSVLSAREAAAALRSVRGRVLLAELTDIPLPLSAKPVPVLLPKSTPATPLDVSGGLIVLLTDKTSQTKQLVPVRFRPRRPTGFATVDTRIDRTTGRIDVEVRARVPGQLPTAGIPVAARLAGSPSDAAVRTHGLLTSRSPTATLRLFAPPGRPTTVHVDVAGWPRAFVFDVVDGTVRPLRDPRIRIVSPSPEAVFGTPSTIATRIEIDCGPEGFPGRRDGFVVGLDTSGDRRLGDEEIVRVARDRDVRVLWNGMSAEGTSSLGVTVDDFDLTVPTRGLKNSRASLLATVSVAGHPTAWAQPVPVVLDSVAPRLVDLEVQPGSTVTIGESIVVQTVADDGGLSGVTSVETAFDPERTGEFGKTTKSVAATPSAAAGRWRAELPTKTLPPGRHMLLVRAVDKAGNASEPRIIWVRAVTPEQSERQLAERTIEVDGTVKYGPEPAAGLKVEAKPTPPPSKAKDESAAEPMKSVSPADSVPPLPNVSAVTAEDGTFRLNGLRSGQYVLTVSGTLRGRRFDFQQPLPVDVDVPPAAIEIRLDRPSRPKDSSEQAN